MNLKEGAMDKRKNIENLRIYQESAEFSNIIWSICNDWDYFTKKSIGLQLIRAADSISANIAEGYGRYFYKENLKFCYYARGSFEETKDWIIKAQKRNLISSGEYKKISDFLNNFPKSLNSYIKYIRNCLNEK